MLVWWSHLESTALKLHRGRGWVGWRETSRPEGRSGEGRGSRWKFVPVTRKCIFSPSCSHWLRCRAAVGLLHDDSSIFCRGPAGEVTLWRMVSSLWSLSPGSYALWLFPVGWCPFQSLWELYYFVSSVYIWNIYIYLYASITRLIIDFFKVRCLLGSDETHIRYAMGSPVLW